MVKKKSINSILLIFSLTAIVWGNPKNIPAILFDANQLLQSYPAQFSKVSNFREAMANMQSGNYLEACKLFNQVGSDREAMNQLLIYHIAYCRWKLGNLELFERIVKLIKSGLAKNNLADMVVQDILNQDSKYDNSISQKLIVLFPELNENYDFLNLYLPRLTHSDKNEEIINDIWLKHPSYTWEKLKKDYPHLKQSFENIEKSNDINTWEKYFSNKFDRQQYSEIIEKAPDILDEFTEDNSQKKHNIVKYYVLSLFNKKRYSATNYYLSSTKNAPILKIFPEMHLVKIDAMLKIGKTDESILYLNELSKTLDNKFIINQANLKIGDYFFFYDQEYSKALDFFNKIDLAYLPESSKEQFQWQNLLSAYLKDDSDKLKELYKWYEKRKFRSENLNAHFCYWLLGKAYKKIDLSENRVEDCYAQFNNQYYGIKSIANDNFYKMQQHLFEQQKSIINYQPPDADTLKFIEIIKILNDFDQKDLASYFLKQDFLTFKDINYLKAIFDSTNDDKMYYLAQNLYISVLGGKSLKGEFFDPNFFKSLYPKAFQDLVINAAKSFNIPPNLVYSIMREESHYNHIAVSKAGALGLMQIIPSTAREISKQLKIQISPDKYIDTANNILMGAFYLSQLSKMFNGNLIHIIAAYNAGPKNVKKWIKKYSTTDQDVFIEMIPFGETRRYVKRVLRSYLKYQILYNI